MLWPMNLAGLFATSMFLMGMLFYFQTKYILLRDLGGAMVWTINSDDKDGTCGMGRYPLIRSVRDVLTDAIRRNRRNISDELDEYLESSAAELPAVIDWAGPIRRIDGEIVRGFPCTRQGYYRHPFDCTRFYRCVKFDQLKDQWTIFQYDCPIGLVFDERFEVCNWPSWSPPCDGSGEVLAVPRNKFVCPGLGYFQDPENCRWFFYCSDFGEGIAQAYEFKCPYDLAFDEADLMCNWRWLVPGCGEARGDYGAGASPFRGGPRRPGGRPRPPTTTTGQGPPGRGPSPSTSRPDQRQPPGSRPSNGYRPTGSGSSRPRDPATSAPPAGTRRPRPGSPGERYPGEDAGPSRVQPTDPERRLPGQPIQDGEGDPFSPGTVDVGRPPIVPGTQPGRPTSQPGSQGRPASERPPLGTRVPPPIRQPYDRTGPPPVSGVSTLPDDIGDGPLDSPGEGRPTSGLPPRRPSVDSPVPGEFPSRVPGGRMPISGRPPSRPVERPAPGEFPSRVPGDRRPVPGRPPSGPSAERPVPGEFPSRLPGDRRPAPGRRPSRPSAERPVAGEFPSRVPGERPTLVAGPGSDEFPSRPPGERPTITPFGEGPASAQAPSRPPYVPSSRGGIGRPPGGVPQQPPDVTRRPEGPSREDIPGRFPGTGTTRRPPGRPTLPDEGSRPSGRPTPGDRVPGSSATPQLDIPERSPGTGTFPGVTGRPSARPRPGDRVSGTAAPPDVYDGPHLPPGEQGIQDSEYPSSPGSKPDRPSDSEATRRKDGQPTRHGSRPQIVGQPEYDEKGGKDYIIQSFDPNDFGDGRPNIFGGEYGLQPEPPGAKPPSVSSDRDRQPPSGSSGRDRQPPSGLPGRDKRPPSSPPGRDRQPPSGSPGRDRKPPIGPPSRDRQPPSDPPYDGQIPSTPSYGRDRQPPTVPDYDRGRQPPDGGPPYDRQPPVGPVYGRDRQPPGVSPYDMQPPSAPDYGRDRQPPSGPPYDSQPPVGPDYGRDRRPPAGSPYDRQPPSAPDYGRDRQPPSGPPYDRQPPVGPDYGRDRRPPAGSPYDRQPPSAPDYGRDRQPPSGPPYDRQPPVGPDYGRDRRPPANSPYDRQPPSAPDYGRERQPPSGPPYDRQPPVGPYYGRDRQPPGGPPYDRQPPSAPDYGRDRQPPGGPPYDRQPSVGPDYGRDRQSPSGPPYEGQPLSDPPDGRDRRPPTSPDYGRDRQPPIGRPTSVPPGSQDGDIRRTGSQMGYDPRLTTPSYASPGFGTAPPLSGTIRPHDYGGTVPQPPTSVTPHPGGFPRDGLSSGAPPMSLLPQHPPYDVDRGVTGYPYDGSDDKQCMCKTKIIYIYGPPPPPGATSYDNGTVILADPNGLLVRQLTDHLRLQSGSTYQAPSKFGAQKNIKAYIKGVLDITAIKEDGSDIDLQHSIPMQRISINRRLPTRQIPSSINNRSEETELDIDDYTEYSSTTIPNPKSRGKTARETEHNIKSPYTRKLSTFPNESDFNKAAKTNDSGMYSKYATPNTSRQTTQRRSRRVKYESYPATATTRNSVAQQNESNLESSAYQSEAKNNTLVNYQRGSITSIPYLEVLHDANGLATNQGDKLVAKVSNVTSLPEVACIRPGLFQHPDDCNKYYECYWDQWINKFTIHMFECPIKLAFNSRVLGCSPTSGRTACIKPV